MAKRVVKLSVVRSQRKANEAKAVRSELFGSARGIVRDVGDGFGGFALIVWNRKGEVYSALSNRYGPLRGRSLPMLCQDAINAHITLDMVDGLSSLPDEDNQD